MSEQHEYESLVYWKQEKVENIGPWAWIATDTGAWEGPHQDWIDHKKLLHEHIPKFEFVIQAGGCQGLYPRLYATFTQRIITLEPDELNFFCLVQNCQLERIIKIQAALSDQLGMCGMNRVTMANTGMHGIKEGIYIPTLTLDTFINVPALTLIHLDVEGHEYKALVGGIELIKKFMPAIMVERGQTDEIKTLLGGLGYVVKGTSVSDTLWMPGR